MFHVPSPLRAFLLVSLLTLGACQNYHGPIDNHPDPNWGSPSRRWSLDQISAAFPPPAAGQPATAPG